MQVLPTCLPLIRSPGQPSHQRDQVHFLLIPQCGFLFPTSPQSYSYTPVTSFCRNPEVTHPLASIKLAFYSYWLFTFFNKLLSISSVQGQGHIFGHPHKPKIRIPPLQWDEEEVIKIQATCGEAREIPLVWNSEVLVTVGMWLWDPISRILHTWRGSMPGDSRALVSRLTWPHQWNSLA